MANSSNQVYLRYESREDFLRGIWNDLAQFDQFVFARLRRVGQRPLLALQFFAHPLAVAGLDWESKSLLNRTKKAVKTR